jgi:hypothetical protein
VNERTRACIEGIELLKREGENIFFFFFTMACVIILPVAPPKEFLVFKLIANFPIIF